MICDRRAAYYETIYAEWLAKYRIDVLQMTHVYESKVTVGGITTVRCSWCWKPRLQCEGRGH
jgi:hypothetical protein